MKTYEFSQAGLAIVEKTGLVDLSEKVIEKPWDHSNIFALLNDEGWYFSEIKPDEEHAQDFVEEISTKIKDQDNLREASKALSIEPGVSLWGYDAGPTPERLFDTTTDFVPATWEDRLILSGLAGLTLTNYRSVHPILAKSRYREWGFANFTQACALAGAFVTKKLVETRPQSLDEGTPGFLYTKGGLTHRIKVGGNIHGDFLMNCSTHATEGAISPTGTKTMFSPVEEIYVSGYHSIEKDFTAAIIAQAYLSGGKKPALDLANSILELIGTSDNEEHTESRSFLFADYGERERDRSTVEFIYLIGGRALIGNVLLERIVSPGNQDFVLQVINTSEGIRLQNADKKTGQELQGIDIPKEQYLMFVQALILQAQGGHGRSSIIGHKNVAERAIKTFS